MQWAQTSVSTEARASRRRRLKRRGATSEKTQARCCRASRYDSLTRPGPCHTVLTPEVCLQVSDSSRRDNSSTHSPSFSPSLAGARESSHHITPRLTTSPQTRRACRPERRRRGARVSHQDPRRFSDQPPFPGTLSGRHKGPPCPVYLCSAASCSDIHALHGDPTTRSPAGDQSEL